MTAARGRREEETDAPAAPGTQGLDRLDRERASSLADEGGASGAAVDSEDDTPTPARPRRLPRETIPGPDGRPIDRWSEEGRRRARRLRKGLFAIVLLASATSAQAGAYLTPFVGAAFGGDTADSQLTYGGSLTLAGDGIVGFAVDFGYTKDFFGETRFRDSNMTTLMGNLVLLSPGRTRVYGSGGLGLMKTSVQDVSGFFDIDSNELGLDVGGGIIFMAGDHFGIQGDIRYFRQLTDPEPDDEFDVDLGSLHFWRATGGIAIRF